MNIIRNTIRGKILISVISSFLIILVFVFSVNYIVAKNNLFESYDALMAQTEKSVRDSIVQMDNSYKMVERLLMPSVKAGFTSFLEAYARSDGDPARMDLDGIKVRLGGTMDLYVIDSGGVIRFATFKPAVGIDFKQYPTYYEGLTKIRTGNDYVGDRLNVDLKTATLRYWGFMPSPDHKYVFELGVVPSGIQEMLREMDISSIEKGLKERNPLLMQVRLFNWIGYNYYDPNVAPTQEILKILDKVKNGGSYEFEDKAGGRFVHYSYVDLLNKSGIAMADPSYMVELTYNTGMIYQKLQGLLMYNLIAGFLAILLGIVIIFVIANKITRPVILLNDAVKEFTGMKLNARAPVLTHDEIGRLSGAFNTMAATIEEYSAEVEEKVEERTRKLTETFEQLRETQEQVIQHEKMASIGMLVAGIAHEINTPLASIKSNTDMEKMCLAQVQLTDRQNMEEFIGNIRSFSDINEMALDRIIDIVRNLKNFVRLDESDFKEVDVHEGIDSTLLLVNYQLKNKVKVVKDYGELPPVACFPRQLNQVFLNIIMNAAHAVDKDGELRITTRCAAGRVTISFKDNGCGIAENHLKKLFEPGFTTKGAGMGTGLGLSISHKIIEKHHGNITVKSEVGKGSEFTLELPVKQA